MTKTAKVGDTFKITATTKPSGVPAEILWTTADGTIDMTFTGKTATITALEPGVATVEAQLKDNKDLKAKTEITINEE